MCAGEGGLRVGAACCERAPLVSPLCLFLPAFAQLSDVQSARDDAQAEAARLKSELTKVRACAYLPPLPRA